MVPVHEQGPFQRKAVLHPRVGSRQINSELSPETIATSPGGTGWKSDGGCQPMLVGITGVNHIASEQSYFSTITTVTR